MTDPNAPAQVPPGWYPDVTAPGSQRWWDGLRWTDHVQQIPQEYQPAQPFGELKAPAGTKTGTLWIWLIVLTPLLSLSSLFLVDWAAYVDTSLSASAGVATTYTPGYVVSQLLGFVLYGMTVVFAALDVRELKKRGVPQPFHWAFAFLTTIVYVIGRSVVVKRRTGGGLGPLWGYIGVMVVSFIAFGIFFVLLFQYMMLSIQTF